MNKTKYQRLLSVVLIMTLSSCASLGRDYGALIGCGAGALAGAGIGYLASGSVKGVIIGAGAGTAVGCVAGSIWQNHQKKLEEMANRENLNLKMETLYSAKGGAPVVGDNESGLVSTIESSQMFASSSSKLTISGKRQIKSLAKIFSDNHKSNKQATYLMVIGHTDATGTAEFNQKLSERRARAVGQIFTNAGIIPANIYFQGAGASRPLGSNITIQGRAKNRRVEIVEVTNKKDLLARIKAEQSNIKYLAHGTLANKPKQKRYLKKVPHNTQFKGIDFGGELASISKWNPSTLMVPKSSGLQIISSAQANSLPMKSCFYDSARVSGKVKSFATGAVLNNSYKTKDYLPGMNGRVWANIVNGNLVTISPVKILKENALVVQNPLIQIVKDYDKGSRKTSANLKTIANTYEGESSILYRVFVNSKRAPLSCMDIVINKKGGTSADGKIYYQRGNKINLATFKPQST